jgi:uncharacterized protein YjiS (DUF1127 family)
MMEATMWEWLVDWWAIDLDRQRLKALDDRLLADMGLDREDIDRRVKAADAPPAPKAAVPQAQAANDCALACPTPQP